MEIFHQLLAPDSPAHAVLVLGLVIALGLTLGSLRFWGIQIGIAGVLFAGLVFGHFGISISALLMEFIREFGLILFVYTIGMQVGPGFFSSLRKEGGALNGVAIFIVLFGALIAFCLHVFGGIPAPVTAGLFSGATTNTPSLAAAQQALREIPGISPESLSMPGLGYAVSYPFGVLGIILTMILMRVFFRISPEEEARNYAKRTAQDTALEVMDFVVENSKLHGLSVRQLPAVKEAGIVISRILHEGEIQAALPETKIYLGDILRAVGPAEKLKQLQFIVGSVSQIDFRGAKTHVIVRRVVVTKREMAGRQIAELDARQSYGLTVTRVRRSEIEIPVTADLALQFADVLTVVGEADAIRKFAAAMGDSPRDLDHPQLIPIFIGIALGVILGSLPISIPGMPVPVKLGLAGGPLIVAILLSRVGRIGHLIWYMPTSANFMLREVGISLFLACVGLKSGEQFIRILTEGDGFYWMASATLITLLPLISAAIFCRVKLKMNYLSVCGLLSGGMTNPPALAFANQMAPSSAQSVAYTTIYPLVMLLRVVLAQILVIFLAK